MAPTPPPMPDPPRSGLTEAQRWILGGVAALAVVLLAVLALLARADEDDTVATTTTTSEPTTTTTTKATTTTESTTTIVPVSPVDPFAVAFPSPADSRRFDDPAAAAGAYATDVLGFVDPVVGDAVAAGADGATVEVSDPRAGPSTRVALEREADGTWFATGSAVDDIVVDVPVPRSSLATPFETSGRALAFEGTVEVVVLLQSSPAPIGQGVVTGSGSPPAGPFSGRITFSPPAQDEPGILVFRIHSAEDGRVLAAASLPVRITDADLGG